MHQGRWVIRGSERLVLFNVYGEIATNPEDDCLRGRLLRQYDGAGLVVHASYDFEGNLLEQSRQLTVAHDAVPDWIALDALTTLAAMDSATSSLLDSETFTTEGTFDAFGRHPAHTSHSLLRSHTRRKGAAVAVDTPM